MKCLGGDLELYRLGGDRDPTILTGDLDLFRLGDLLSNFCSKGDLDLYLFGGDLLNSFLTLISLSLYWGCGCLMSLSMGWLTGSFTSLNSLFIAEVLLGTSSVLTNLFIGGMLLTENLLVCLSMMCSLSPFSSLKNWRHNWQLNSTALFMSLSLTTG